MGREKREMAGKESSNSTKLRHYGAFVLAPLFAPWRPSEMGIDAAGRTARDERESQRGDGRKRRLTERRHRRPDVIVS